MSISAGCGLFLLGNYGVAGDFDDDLEESLFFAVMMVGMVALSGTAAWKMLIIRAEINRDQKAADASVKEYKGSGTGVTRTLADDNPVTELSLIWVGLGVTVTTIETVLVITQVSTCDPIYETLACGLLSIVVLLYIVSFFAQPRRKDPRAMWQLRAHFFSFSWVGEISYVIGEISGENKAAALIHIGRLLLQTGLFHYGLKLRASIGRLPDKDLSEFLTDTLFKGGFSVFASMLFVLFRSMKCTIENDSITCSTNTFCATSVSLYLLVYWFLKLVHGSIKEEWRKDLSLSAEKIARLQISWRRTAHGIMLVVMVGCGAFVFTFIGAKEPDKKLVRVICYSGSVAGIACLISEIVTVTKERERKKMQSQLKQPIQTSKDVFVEGCSWMFVGASFFLTALYTILYIINAINLQDWTWKLGGMILPLLGTCMVISTFLRPKDDGAGIIVLHAQFIIFAIGGPIFGCIGAL